MRKLHNAMMGVMLIAVLAFAVGVMRPAQPVAEAQHGHGTEEQAGGVDLHATFAAVVEHLELSEAQRATLAEPLTETFIALQELQRLHGVIMAELTEEQRHRLGSMIHGMMGDASAAEHGERHQGEAH